MIDTSDIRELTATDFAKGRKNPFAEKIKKHGFTISVSEHYSPSDVEDIIKGTCTRFFQLDEDEHKALEEYQAEYLQRSNPNA